MALPRQISAALTGSFVIVGLMVDARSLPLDTSLAGATRSVEASVLVGGTLLWDHSEGLSACVERGVQVRFLFPSPTSAWLADFVISAGATAKDYAHRIEVNSNRAREMGAIVRFHHSPVAIWFAMFDRIAVASKPIAFLNRAMPEISKNLPTVVHFASLFDHLWDHAAEVPSELDPRVSDWRASAGTVRAWVPQERLQPRNSGTSDHKAAKHPFVFLCHASDDKSAVRAVHEKLRVHGINTWLDEVDLLPGHDWDLEIRRAVQQSRAVIVFISPTSISKSGYLQKEIRFVLDVAAEQPEGKIFVIPARLQDCVVPESFRRLQYVDLFEPRGFEKLLQALYESAAK